MTSDSAQLAEYRSALAKLSGSKFYNDDFIPSGATHTILIEGNNFNPVELQAFPVADTSAVYVISSSANPGSYFNGKEGGLFEKIWVNM